MIKLEEQIFRCSKKRYNGGLWGKSNVVWFLRDTALIIHTATSGAFIRTRTYNYSSE